MNNIQVFNNPEFGDIRTIEIDGKPYFVGKDVATALGYSNPTNPSGIMYLMRIKRWGSKTLPHPS